MAAPKSTSTIESMRRSTRLRIEIPVRMRSLDPKSPFDILTHTLIVNAQGCGLQTAAEIPLNTPVEFAIQDRVASGHVLNSTLVDSERKIWVVGVELNQSGNFWGVDPPPADWEAAASPATDASPRIVESSQGKLNPFAKRKAPKSAKVDTPPTAESAATPSIASQAGLPVANAEELRSRFDALLEEFGARLRTQVSTDWERWRADATSALSTIQNELGRELAADADRWRQETQKAADTLAGLLKSSDDRARIAEEQGKQIGVIAAAAQSEIAAAVEKLQRGASTARGVGEEAGADAQSARDEIARLKTELRDLADRAPALVDGIVKERAAQTMDSLGSQVEQKLSSAITAGLQQLQDRLQEMSSAADADLRRRLLADFEDRQEKFLATATTQLAEIQSREVAFRSSADQLLSQLAHQAEQAMAGLRAQVEELVARHESDLTSRLSVRHDEIVRQLGTESERLRLLQAAAEQALHAVDERQQAAAKTQADLARAAEAALQNIDGRHAAAQTALDKAAADSLQKLNAGVGAGQQHLEARLQQQAWEYDAQAEAAGARLQDKLAAALQKLETDIEQKQAALSANLATDGGKVADQVRSTLRGESERYIADIAAERERQAGAFREQIEQEIRQRDAEFQARQREVVANMAALETQHQQVAAELAELQKTRTYIESLMAALPNTIRTQAQQHASEAWDNLRARSEKQISETLQVETQRGAARLLEEIGASALQLRAEMAAHAQQTAARLQDKLAAVLSERQQQLSREMEMQVAQLETRATSVVSTAGEELRRSVAGTQDAAQSAETRLKEAAASASAEFSKQAQLQAENHRVAAEAVYDAARRRLEEVAQKSEHLLGETEATLYKTAGEVATDEIARARREIRESAKPDTDAALAALRADSGSIIAGHTAKISAAAAQAGGIADRLQGFQVTAEAQSKAMQEQLTDAQRWLGEHTAEFQKTVHDSFLLAGGEIRGRVHAAVDSADEMIRQKSKDVMATVDSASAHHAQALARQAEEAQSRILAIQQSATNSAEAVLKSRLADTLDLFREDAARLAESALARWQSAMDDTLHSIPDLLRNNLDAVEKNAASKGASSAGGS